MKRFELCAMGNAMVDILVEISESEFSELGLERGTMRLVQQEEQQVLLKKINPQNARVVSGGSVANSVIAFAQLGGSASFIMLLGDDQHGNFYKSEFNDFGIEVGSPTIAGQVTGSCLSIITPDGERTMRTFLGAGSLLDAETVQEQLIAESQWLFLEGYMLANADHGPRAVSRALNLSKKYGNKLAFTFSEPFIANLFGEKVEEIVKNADLVFANEFEAMAYTGKGSWEEAFDGLCLKVPGVVVTGSDKGALVMLEGEKVRVPAFSCRPIDMTGAGDIFAGSFLYGVSQKLPLEEIARGSCYLAMQLITRIGARLHSGIREYWQEGCSMRSGAAA